MGKPKIIDTKLDMETERMVDLHVSDIEFLILHHTGVISDQ